MRLLLALATFLSLGPFSATATERVRVRLSPQASEALVEILERADELPTVSFPDLTLSSRDKDTPTTEAQCTVKVRCASIHEDRNVPVYSEDNGFRCHYKKNGVLQRATWSFKNDAVYGRGLSWEAPQMEISGVSVHRLALLIQHRLQQVPGHPLLDFMDFAGPAGHQTVTYGILSRPNGTLPNGGIDYATLSVACNFWAQNGTLDRSFCSFASF